MTLTEARAAIREFVDPTDAVFVTACAEHFGQGSWGPPTIKELFRAQVVPKGSGSVLSSPESPSLTAVVESLRQQVAALRANEAAKTAPAESVDAATAGMGCAASLAAPGAGEGGSNG